MAFVVSPTRTKRFPADFASIVTHDPTLSTMPNPEISSVGGMQIVSPFWVVNWLFSESLPEIKGVPYALAAS